MGSADDQYRKFADLTFEDFQRMAQDDSLSPYEKTGSPDSYRKGKEGVTFQSILSNLPLLNEQGKTVLEVGPGCSDLPRLLINLCRERGHKLLLVDSEEMLAHLPEENFIRKFPAYFPQCESIFTDYAAKVDIVIIYSVLHYVFVEGNVWDFLDRSLELLAEGGEMLVGDIPNVSKRRRFFSSARGVKFHQQFMNTQDLPEVHFNRLERHRIDDAVILGLIARARNQGYEAYLLPQPPDLPMANRREDVLIRRP